MTTSAIHNSEDSFKLWVLGILIVAFLLALPLMFVHPGLVIALFWMGLIILGTTVGVGSLVVRSRRAMARHALHAHKCPHCRNRIDEDPTAGGEWHCHACGANYLSSGEECASSAVTP